jgi:nucleotide-binding universal stress UspA family protein
MTWNPILVGVDTSPGAVAAAAFAWKLARAAGTTCHFLHVVPDGNMPLVAPGSPVLDAMDRAMIALARQRLRAALRRKLPVAALSHLEIRFGHPALVLQAEARRLGAELVVLGSKRHSALGRWVSGSTVLDLVRRLDVLLLVTQGSPTELRRILVAVDASPAAKPTIRAATRFERLLGAELRAIHAIEPLPALPEMPLLMPPDEVDTRRTAELERSVWPLLRIPRAMKAVRSGSAPLALAEEAAEWNADLLVVGKQGRGWVDHLLLGSVTERLLNHLPTSLLVVPVPMPSRRPRPQLVGRKARTLLKV